MPAKRKSRQLLPTSPRSSLWTSIETEAIQAALVSIDNAAYGVKNRDDIWSLAIEVMRESSALLEYAINCDE